MYRSILKLISVSFLAVMPFLTAQSASVDFRYCSDISTSIGSGTSGTMYGAAVKIDEETATAFRGCELDSLIVGFGRGSKRDITLFLTYDLSEVPFMICTSKLKAYNQMNKLPLETPYVIEGKPFYIGYRYTCVGQDAKPIAFDMDLKYANPEGGWVCMADDASGLLSGWKNYTSNYGNLTIGCTITGALPSVYLYPMGLEYEDFCVPGQDFPITMMLRNFGGEDAISGTASLSIDGAQAVLVEAENVDPIHSGDTGIMTFSCKSETIGIDMPFEIGVVKSGTTDNPCLRTLYNRLTCSDDVFKRAVVFEEYTGTACGNCPIGIVALEYLREHYDFEHDGLITIAAHQYSTNDPMYCPSYQPWLEGLGFFSAPNSIANRTEFSYPSANRLEEVYKNMRKWAKAKISIDWKYTDEAHSAIDVTTTTVFTETQEDTDYAVALVLVEDKVGPYMQTNYYDDDMSVPEFYGKGKQVKMLFDDVARYINCWNGAEESALLQVEERVEYTYTEQLSLSSCNQPFNTRLVAMLIDRRTNEIINADMVSLNISNAVYDATTDYVRIAAGNNSIVLSGQGAADLFTVDGQRVGTFEAPVSIPVCKGIYVVAPHGGIPVKVCVR